MACVYILRGASGRHHIGSTDNLDRRLREHEGGSNHTTRRFVKVKLVASKQMPSMTEARALEAGEKRKGIQGSRFWHGIRESSPESFRGWLRVRGPSDALSVCD